VSGSELVVTGAAGWLGSALLGKLAGEGGGATGHIRALVHSSDQEAELRPLNPDVEVVVGDVRDPDSLDRLLRGTSQADFIHAAGVIHPSATREFYDVNVGGTALSLQHARRHGVRRFVHVSSNSPFGFNNNPSECFDEQSPYRPYMGYGRSKMEAEQLVARSQVGGELETVIVRCPWFYGPHQPERQTRLFELIRRGRFPIFGTGKNRRSMVYTEDLAAGILLASRTPGVSGKKYWIADSRPYEMTEILDAVRAALGAEGYSVTGSPPRLPGIISDVARRADAALQSMGRYSQSIHVLSEMNQTIACTIERARAELGYEPSVGLEEGMHRSLRSAIEEGKFAPARG
jgi:nucleoside-diphosphate-sugar epimerase